MNQQQIQTTSVDVADIVGFATSGETSSQIHDEVAAIDSLLGALKPTGESTRDIRDFLSRWVYVNSKFFSSSYGKGTVLISFDVLSTIRNNSMYAAKLRGFVAMNAKLEVRIVVNSQPFQTGILALAFLPFAKNHMTSTYALAGLQNEKALPFLTGCPGAILNIGKETSLEFGIPYVGPNVAINLSNEEADWGTCVVYVLNELRGPTSGEKVDVAVYMRLVDVEAFGATVQALETAEREGVVNGPSSSLAQVAEPVVSALAPQVTFVAQAAKDISRLYGFSKPNASPDVNRMAFTPFGQMTNVDGNCTAFKIATSSDQNTRTAPFGLTDQDEMSISHIASRPSYLTSFEWKSSASRGDELVWIPVSPNCTLFDGDDFFPTPLRFISNFFQYWRGGLAFTLHFATSKFHSGRLRFVYKLTMNSISNSDIHYCYSQIYDLREATTIRVECPWVSTTAWRTVPWKKESGWFRPDAPAKSMLSEFSCVLSILVETPLIYAPSVSDTVGVTVFVEAMQDFELSCPDYTLAASFNNFNGENESAYATTAKAFAQALHGDFDCKISMIDTPPSAEQQLATQLTMGEKVVSVRQLIKRYSYLGEGEYKDGTNFVIAPFLNKASYRSKDKKHLKITSEFLYNIAPLYRFWRGGVRILLVPESDFTRFTFHFQPYIKALKDPTDFESDFGYYAPLARFDWKKYRSFTASLETVGVQGGLEVQFPFYSAFPFLLTGVLEHDTTKFSEYVTSIYKGERPAGIGFVAMHNLIIQTSADTSGKLRVYRSAADDFQLCYMIGAPACTIRADDYKPT